MPRVGESVAEPERYLHNNADKSRVLIDAALGHGVSDFIFSSTCAVYGLPQTDLLAETHRIALDAAVWAGKPPPDHLRVRVRVRFLPSRGACDGRRGELLCVRYSNGGD